MWSTWVSPRSVVQLRRRQTSIVPWIQSWWARHVLPASTIIWMWVSATPLTLASQRLTDTQVQHRCDDLKSLEYMLLYFLRDCLSWQGLTVANQKQKKKLILTKKKTISTKDLCKNLSWKFATYFDHIRSRDFDDNPQYFYLRKIFRDLFVRESFEYDRVFDWTILKYLMTIQWRELLRDRGECECLVEKICIRSLFKWINKIEWERLKMKFMCNLWALLFNQ